MSISAASRHARMACEIIGTGEPVVMVHGLGGTGNVWGPQAAALQRYYKVVRPDLVGSGRTPLDDGEVTISRLVQDMVALLDELAIGTAHLVGHSMGTIICQHLAAWHPERVRSLALMGPIAAPPEPARAAIRARAEKCRAEGMIPVADAIVQGGTSAETKAARPEVAAFVREILMRQDAEAYARTCEALAAAEAADPARIRCPTLLVTGDEDATSPPAATQALAARIAGARLLILPRCGHWTPIERPAEVTQALFDLYFGVGR